MSYHHGAATTGWEEERPSRTFREEYGQTVEADDDADGQMIRRPSHMRSSDYDDDEDENYGHSAVRSNKDSIPGLARPRSGQETALSSKILSPRSASHTHQFPHPAQQRPAGVSSSALGSRRSPSENGSSRDNWQSTTSRQPEASHTSYPQPDSISSKSNKLLGILNNTKPICSDYLAGRCRFGVLCHLRHALPTEDNVQTAHPARDESMSNQRESSTTNWGINRGDVLSSPPTGSRYHHRQPSNPEPQQYRQSMEPPRSQYGQPNTQDDGWPVYKQLPPSLSAPVEPIAPEKPTSTSYQVARSSGWVSQDSAMQPSSRSEVASPKVDRLEREPIASSSKSAMEPGPRTQDNGWNRQYRSPSRSGPHVPARHSPPPVPQIPQQYSSQASYNDNHHNYRDNNSNYRDTQSAATSSGTQDDGWPAYKPCLAGWEEPIIPYSPANDRRDSPIPTTRRKAVWTSLDPEFAGQTSDTYAESGNRQTDQQYPANQGYPTRRSEGHSVRTSTPPLHRSQNKSPTTPPLRRTVSPPQQSPLREQYASRQWQTESGHQKTDDYMPEQRSGYPTEPWKTADITTNGRKHSFGEARNQFAGEHREKPQDDPQMNTWISRPTASKQNRSAGASAPLMTLGEYLADEGSNEQVARLTGQTLAQVEDGQRSSNNNKSMVTLPSGWSVPAEAFHDDSIRPSESASNIGGTTNSSSSAAEGRDVQPIARPPRQGRQWQPYVGDAGSDASSQEEKTPPSIGSETGWNADKPETSPKPTSPDVAAVDQPSSAPKSSWTVPQDETKSSWLAPEQHGQNGWRSPSQAVPLPAPTPRRGDAHDFGVVTDLERAATPRAAPSVSKDSIAQEHTRETSGSSGRAISIIGASKYHAETMQLRDEIDLLRKEKAELEARLASATSTKPIQTQPASSNLERENDELRAKIFALETERETIRAIMLPILGILGLHGQKLEIRIAGGEQASAKKAPAPDKEVVANGWR